jgi:hypothetical protein
MGYRYLMKNFILILNVFLINLLFNVIIFGLFFNALKYLRTYHLLMRKFYFLIVNI